MSTAQVNSYSSLRNTMREFETTLILRPDINKDGIISLVTRLRAVFEKTGGRMQKIDNWGLRTLAYPILTQSKGIYLYVRYLGGSDTVQELERNLRIWEEIVRYLTIQVDLDVDPGARPEDVDAETLAAASDTAPDPIEVAAARAAEEAAARAAEEAAARAAAAAEAEAQAAAQALAKAAESDNTEATEETNG